MMLDTTQTQTNGISKPNADNIVVMGATKEAPVTENKETVRDSQETKTEVVNPEEVSSDKQETAELKSDGAKETEAKEEKKPEPIIEDKEEEKPKQGLKIDFGLKKEKEDSKKDDSVNKQETATAVTKESVIDFLRSNGFDEINDLSELSKKTTLPESVQKYNDFYDETGGRSIKDFYNLQREWKSEPQETRIKEFLRLKYPDLDESQIETQFDVVKVTEEDEDMLTPRELNRAKAEFDKMDSEAVKFLTDKSKQYKVPLENKQQEPNKPVTQEDIAKTHGDYWKARDKSLNEFNEFRFNIEGLGEVKIPIDADDKRIISKGTATADDMVGRWMDNENKSLKTKELVTDNAWGIPSIREKMLASMAEQIHALTLDKFSKENRNVDLDDLNSKSRQKSNTNGHMVKIEDRNKQDSSSFGTPIISRR